MPNGIFPTRIRSVKFKNGGEIRLLPSIREETSRSLKSHLKADTDSMWAGLGNKIAGYALVDWTSDGDIGGYVRNESTSPYVGTAVPHLVTEQIRRVLNSSQINRALGGDQE